MPDPDLPLYPLKFEPIYKQKVWGGRTLAMLGRTLPGADDMKIGESWELADLGATSASGGDGGEARSTIANGPLTGMPLHEAIHVFDDRLMGQLKWNDDGDFPLLFKYLDARENLSVQVHPSADYAQTHPGSHIKSEAWYVVDAEPGAVLYKGLREGVTPPQLREAIASNIVPELLIAVPARQGDCHYLPSGTCHALGAGLIVAEVQTPSDTTFRVYDWGRSNREVHINPALECIHFGPSNTKHYEKRSHIAGMFTTVTRLVTSEHFRIEKIRMVEGYEQEIPYDQPVVWMVLEGEGTITTADGMEPVASARGETLLIPAQMNDACLSLKQDTVWLEITFPQALAEQIA